MDAGMNEQMGKKKNISCEVEFLFWRAEAVSEGHHQQRGDLLI